MRAILLAIVLGTLSGCSTHSNHTENISSDTPKNIREYQVGAYLWQQTSGEYRALTYQAYNVAKTKVEQELLEKHNKKRAVIFDIDETVLDNSVGGARDIVRAGPWRESDFADWVKLKQAVAVPGALDFTKFLAEKRIEIFYVSNRQMNMLEDTYENLTKLGFPVKKENILMMKENTPSKEERRQDIQKKYKIVLLVGDNLTDFNIGFDKQTVEGRNALVDQMKNDFGEKYIILPNPLYGDWERALPKKKLRLENLRVE
jgi:5'-nucleotidase (lipoprotein e(P4) family)